MTSISTVDEIKIDCNNAQEMLLDDHYIEALLHGDYDLEHHFPWRFQHPPVSIPPHQGIYTRYYNGPHLYMGKMVKRSNSACYLLRTCQFLILGRCG